MARTDDETWIYAFDRVVLRRLLGGRTFDLALSSDLRYVDPPVVRDAIVYAAVVDGMATSRVSFKIPDAETFQGECSRCLWTFGPCVHAGVVAIDLTCSDEMRAAVLEHANTELCAAKAPLARRAVRLDLTFSGALSDWLLKDTREDEVEIAVSPLDESDVPVARAYGDKLLNSAGLMFAVRRSGERKLLSSQDVGALSCSSRDKSVLTYAADRGHARKARFAIGPFASIALEAMRKHGQIYAEGFKGFLNFRGMTVRPRVALAEVNDAPRGFAALTAVWCVDPSDEEIRMDQAVFFAGPFPYVWTKTGVIYRVAPDVDIELAERFVRHPVLYVPPGRMKDAGARLVRGSRGRGVALPNHEAFGLPPIETPQIVLRLAGDALNVDGNLVAVYREHEVELFSEAWATLPEDGRDVLCETLARERVVAAGLRPHTDDPESFEASQMVKVRGEAAVSFWRDGLVSLRDSRDPSIEVRLTSGLANVRVGTPLAARVHVVLEGDWLKAKLEFNSGQLPVELERVRRALENKSRWVVLDDGTLSRISLSMEELCDEAAGVLGKKAQARLPVHQLGRLDRWIEDNDGRVDAAVTALRKNLRALAVSTEPAMPKKLMGELRPYQKLGLAWLQFLRALGAGGILADDMGLGKTITTLAFLQCEKERQGREPSLVVCPTSVLNNWVTEAVKFTPSLKVLVLHGASRDLSKIGKYDLVITSYGLLRRDIPKLSKVHFRCAILDEAQNIKNPESATTHAASLLDATMRLALSGTPMENRLRELWSISSFANPGILGTLRAFDARFERPIVADKSTPLARELRSVVRPFLLRRTKKDVLPELPPKTEIDRVLYLSTQDKKMYDALALTVRASLKADRERRGLRTNAIGVFAALTRLRQMACDPRLIDPSLANDVSAKREAFLDIVRELVASGRRALVFSQFVQLLTLWRKDLDKENIEYLYLDGSTTKRSEIVAQFQEGCAPLFLISLKAGGAGLNLTAADTVIHCDPWWNPAVEDQATDRAYRIGQDKPVTVIRLVAKGTIEEKILSLKATKRELTDAVIGDDARALDGLTSHDIELLLGETDIEEFEEPANLTEMLATERAVLDPAFNVLAEEVRRWVAQTGRLESELASAIDVPAMFASRLLKGEPFPCSRAVAERIRARVREG